MHSGTAGRERILHNGIESVAIRVPAEEILPMVAAQRHVIDAAWRMQSTLARHPYLPGLHDLAYRMIATVAAGQPDFRRKCAEMRYCKPGSAVLRDAFYRPLGEEKPERTHLAVMDTSKD